MGSVYKFVFADGRKAGIAAITAASMMWAIEPVLAKLAFTGSDFLHTSAVRAVIVTLIALPYALFTNNGTLRVTARQFSTLLYIAVAGTLIADLMYFYCLTMIPVVNAVLIGHMQPLFVVLIGYFMLKQDRITRYDYAGIIIMMTAGFLVSAKTPQNLACLKLGTFGDLLALTATIAWSTTTIAMRKYLRDMNAGVITFYRFALASVVFIILLLPSLSTVVFNKYQILLGIAVSAGTILYYHALRRIKAAQVSALELSTPLFSAVLGYIVLGESVTKMQALAIVLMFAGVYFLSKKEYPTQFV